MELFGHPPGKSGEKRARRGGNAARPLRRRAAGLVAALALMLALPLAAVAAVEAPNWPAECPLCGGGECQWQVARDNDTGVGTKHHEYVDGFGVAEVAISPEAPEINTVNENTGEGNVEAKPPAAPGVPAGESQAANQTTGGGDSAPRQAETASQAGQATGQANANAGGGLDGLLAEGKGFVGAIGSFITGKTLFGIRLSTILIAAGALVLLAAAAGTSVKALRKRRRKSGKP